MFSYIYAEGNSNHRGLTYFSSAKTEEGVKRIALEYIRGMVIGVSDNKPGTNPTPELKSVIDAIEARDVQKAILAWNHYATMELKHTIALHAIEPIQLVE